MRNVTLWVAMAFMVCAGSTGCGENAAPAQARGAQTEVEAASADGRPAQSPADIARLLQSLHQQRAYTKIAPLIVSDRRETTITLLKAIDEVLDANAALQRMAEQRYAALATETWDLAAMENNLGPFSKRVRLISQRFRGDTAVVTLQEGDNVPLVHAGFELAGAEWQFRPEPMPARMVAELKELARVLRDVGESVRLGAPSESYLDAFMYRVLPQMGRVVTAADGPPLVAATANEAE